MEVEPIAFGSSATATEPPALPGKRSSHDSGGSVKLHIRIGNGTVFTQRLCEIAQEWADLKLK